MSSAKRGRSQSEMETSLVEFGEESLENNEGVWPRFTSRAHLRSRVQREVFVRSCGEDTDCPRSVCWKMWNEMFGLRDASAERLTRLWHHSWRTSDAVFTSSRSDPPVRDGLSKELIVNWHGLLGQGKR